MFAAAAMLIGIGFTMALFIAELAFDPTTFPSAKAGILSASVVAGVFGPIALFLLSRHGNDGALVLSAESKREKAAPK